MKLKNDFIIIFFIAFSFSQIQASYRGLKSIDLEFISYINNDFTKWQPLGKNLFVRCKKIGTETVKGRKMVLLKVQLKQNIKILNEESSDFGNYRVKFSRQIAGPNDDQFNMPEFGIEFSRNTEEIYEIPEIVYYPKNMDNGEIKGKFNEETGLIDYTPIHDPKQKRSGALYLFKHCEDQSFKGVYYMCKGVDFKKAK